MSYTAAENRSLEMVRDALNKCRNNRPHGIRDLSAILQRKTSPTIKAKVHFKLCRFAIQEEDIVQAESHLDQTRKIYQSAAWPASDPFVDDDIMQYEPDIRALRSVRRETAINLLSDHAENAEDEALPTFAAVTQPARINLLDDCADDAADDDNNALPEFVAAAKPTRPALAIKRESQDIGDNSNGRYNTNAGVGGDSQTSDDLDRFDGNLLTSDDLGCIAGAQGYDTPRKRRRMSV
jgi:hypothetical protein